MIYRCVYTLILTIICLPLLSTTVDASTSQTSLSVTPAILDVGGATGERTTTQLRITNQSEAFRPIRLGAYPHQSSREGAQPNRSTIRSADTWISFEAAEFILSPGEQRTVTVHMDVPDSGGPGGHYADIRVRALVLDNPAQLTTTLPEVTVTTLVTVTGDSHEQHETALLDNSFRIISAPRSTQLAEVTYKITNAGNVHSLFRPSLRVDAETGATYTVTHEPVLLLPQESEVVSFALPDELPSGLYKASLDYTYGTSTQSIDSPTADIFILPFSLYWFTLPIYTALAAGLYHYRHRLQKAFRILRYGTAEE